MRPRQAKHQVFKFKLLLADARGLYSERSRSRPRVAFSPYVRYLQPFFPSFVKWSTLAYFLCATARERAASSWRESKPHTTTKRRAVDIVLDYIRTLWLKASNHTPKREVRSKPL